ncbi:MAG: SbcC/MukB-like Walker B domain-containing protein, partial [Acholeplasmataceae bacterium]
ELQEALKRENERSDREEKEISDLTKRIRDQEDILSQAIDLIGRIHAKEKRIEQDERLLALYSELAEEESELDKERARFEREHRIFTEQEEAFREKTRRYLNGQATLLAESLEEGKPCPVCGSTHHPDKARATDETISHQDHEKNERAYEKALARYRETESRLERLIENSEDKQESIRKMVKELGYASSIDMETVRQKVADQKKELAALNRKRIEIDRTESALKRSKVELSEREAHKETIGKQRTESQRTIDRLSGEINRIESDLKRVEHELAGEKRELSELKRIRDALGQAIERNIERIDSIRESYRINEQDLEHERSALETIEQDLAEAKTKHEKTQKDYEKELFAHFSSADEFERALAVSEHVEAMRKSVKAHDDAVQQNKKWLEIIEEEIKDQEKIDTEPLQKELAVLEERSARIKEENRQLDIRYSRNAELESTIEKTFRSAEKARKDYEKAQGIADIARGMRGNRVSFERYVLAYFFNEILIVANQKLAKMTGERYALMRKADRMKGAAKQGLDLMIHDAYTTKTRDVSTLSGGESFKVALALALGLAEIVERNAGGISLETMFIDEGFGTLDQESLDMAIETLLSINRAGRVVGMISHVQELKDRIETKITLEITNEGSRIR